MKMILVILALPAKAWQELSRLVGRSGQRTGRAGPVNYARKANTGQTQSKGVPYLKDKEQSTYSKGETPSNAGSNVSNSAQRGAKSARNSKAENASGSGKTR